MTSLAATIPRYILLNIQIYLLRALLLVLAGADYAIGITLHLISTTSPQKIEPVVENSGSDCPAGESPAQRPDDALVLYVDEEDDSEDDSEDTISEPECYSASEYTDAPCDEGFTHATYLAHNMHAVEALEMDLNFLITALDEGIEAFVDCNDYWPLAQSISEHKLEYPTAEAEPINDTLCLSSPANTQSTDTQEHSAIIRPYSPKRFSLRIHNFTPNMLRDICLTPRADYGTFNTMYDLSDILSPVPLSRRDKLTSLALSSNAARKEDGNEEVTLSPALMWSPNTNRVKVVVSLPVKRSRRKKASSIVVWANDGGYGDLRTALEEMGR